jgi:hypothetical protein
MTMMAAPTAIALLLTMVSMSAASIASLQLTVNATGSDMPAAAADQRATQLEQPRGVQAQHAAQQLLCVLQLCNQHGPSALPRRK